MKINFARFVAASAVIMASSAAFAQTSSMDTRGNVYLGVPGGDVNNGGPSTSQKAGAESKGGAQGGLADEVTTGSISRSGDTAPEMSGQRVERYRR